jgi:hypothetical protein
LYGRPPRYFVITATDKIASVDVQEWLDARSLILDSVKQHLLRMQHRMKFQADKHRREREFAVGDRVFLRLQPYIQSSVARRSNHKLAFKFFGPFEILERVGAVAYRLQLPPESKVHPVFHVSQLKPCVGPGTQVSVALPSFDNLFQVPVHILHRRMRARGHRMISQGLVHWSGAPEEQATWEDLEDLHRRFPQAPAWGQAGFQGEGIVNDPGPSDKEGEGSPNRARPKRSKRGPKWLSDGSWVT